MRQLLAIVITLATLWSTNPLTAEATEKFGWIEVTEGLVPFHTDPPDLSFETYNPKGFFWTATDEIPPEFTKAGVFSSLRQIYTGTGPAGADGFEIHIYIATIIPERVLSWEPAMHSS